MSDHQYLNISLSQIQVFLTVAEYKNFTLAAQRLNLTQSAVSKTIATLEGIMQISLFDRKKNLSLTPAGELLNQQWSGLIARIEQSILEASLLNEKQKEVLKVGIPNYLTFKDLLPKVQSFLQDNPNIALIPEEVDFNELFLQLQLGGYDNILTVSISRELLMSMGATCTDISVKVPGLITMSKDNPLAKRKSITLEDLRDEGFFALSSAAYQPYSDLLEAVCKKAGFSPVVDACFPNVKSLIATTIVTGKGMFLSNSLVAEIDHPKLKSFVIDGLESNLIIAWMEENRKKKPALTKLIKAMSI